VAGAYVRCLEDFKGLVDNVAGNMGILAKWFVPEIAQDDKNGLGGEEVRCEEPEIWGKCWYSCDLE